MKIVSNGVLRDAKIKMLRGFQIWPQNSNRITFDPLLSKIKRRKLAQYPIQPILTVFGHKGGKILFDFNF